MSTSATNRRFSSSCSSSTSSRTTSTSTNVKTTKARSQKNLVRYNGNIYEQVELDIELVVGLPSSSSDYYYSSTPTSSSSWLSSTATATAPTTVNVASLPSPYGMTVSGYCPTRVHTVADGGLACRAGVRRGDLIVRVNGVNCCRARLKSVVGLFKQAARMSEQLSSSSTSLIKLTLYRPISAAATTTNAANPTPSRFYSQKTKFTEEKPVNGNGNKKSLWKRKLAHAHVQQTTTGSSSLKSKLLSKLLRKPASLWFSCAQQSNNNNQTLHYQSTFYFSAAATGSAIQQPPPHPSTPPPTPTTSSQAAAAAAAASIYTSLIETNLNAPATTAAHEVVNDDHNSHENIVRSVSSSSTAATADTGYETLTTNRYDFDFMPASTLFQMPIESSGNVACTGDDDEVDEDFEVTMTVNSYSDIVDDVTLGSGDTTVKHGRKKTTPAVAPTSSTATLGVGVESDDNDSERFKEMRTRLIGDLIELEANFVSYLTMAVATFSRPLRGFFINQSDYYCLFQNIEKILVISENFLHSMDKWSAYDLYTKIGQLYSHKMSVFKEAYTMYARGYRASQSLLAELRRHSKQFRLFLSEVECAELTLHESLDLPIVHVQRTLDIFKRIRASTRESRRNPAEAPHLDSVILELRAVLANIDTKKPEIATSPPPNLPPPPPTTTTVTNTPSNSAQVASSMGAKFFVDDDDDDEDGSTMMTEFTMTSLDDDTATTSTMTTSECCSDLTTITEHTCNNNHPCRRRHCRHHHRHRRLRDTNSCCSSSSSSSSDHDHSRGSFYGDDDAENNNDHASTMFLSPISHHDQSRYNHYQF